MKKILLIFGLLTALLLQGQTQFISKASRYSMGQFEEFTLTYTINEQGRNFIEPSDMRRYFNVISGPSTSMQSYMDNNGFRTSFTISYVLQARQIGTFTIGEASIEAGGKKYTAKPVTIEVSARRATPTDPNDPAAIAAKLAYARALLSKKEVYVGEPVSLQYKLYLKTDVRQWEILNQPDFNSFYKQQIDENNRQAQVNKEVIQGEEVSTAVIYKALLIPQKAGTYTPGSLDIKIPTGVPTNRVDFWTNRPVFNFVNQVSTHNLGRITVKPLPEQGKPDDFTGGVGDFKLELIVSRKELLANESLTLKYKLSGTGNLKLVELPSIVLPQTLETFEPKSIEKININEQGMSGSKTLEYLVIPRYAGEYKIPSLSLSYFDVKAKKYKTLSTDEVIIQVTGGPKYSGNSSGTEATGRQSTDKEAVDFLSKDIRFIKTQHSELIKKQSSFFGSSSYYWVLSLLIIAFPLMALLFFVVNRGKQSAFAKSRSLAITLQKHLKAARKLKAQNSQSVAAELDHALALLWKETLQLAPADQNSEKIIEQLREKNVSETDIEATRKLLDQLSMARFGMLRNQNTEQLIADTEQLIKRISEIS